MSDQHFSKEKQVSPNEQEHAPQNDYERMVQRDRWLLTNEEKLQSLLRNGTGFQKEMLVVTRIKNKDGTTSVYLKFFPKPTNVPSQKTDIVPKDIEGSVENTEVYQIQALSPELTEQLIEIGEKIQKRYIQTADNFTEKAKELENKTTLTETEIDLKENYLKTARYLKDNSIAWSNQDWIPTVLQKMRLEDDAWVPDETHKPEFSLPAEVHVSLQDTQTNPYKVHESSPPKITEPDDDRKTPFALAETYQAMRPLGTEETQSMPRVEDNREQAA